MTESNNICEYKVIADYGRVLGLTDDNRLILIELYWTTDDKYEHILCTKHEEYLYYGWPLYDDFDINEFSSNLYCIDISKADDCLELWCIDKNNNFIEPLHLEYDYSSLYQQKVELLPHEQKQINRQIVKSIYNTYIETHTSTNYILK